MEETLVKLTLISLVLISMIIFGCAKATDPVKVEKTNILTLNNVYPTVGIPEDMIVTEGKIFLAEDQAGFSIFDRTTGTLASRVSEWDLNSHFSNVRQLGYAAYHNKLFVFDRFGPARIFVFNVEDIENPAFEIHLTGGELDRIYQFYTNSVEDGNIELAISNTNSVFRYGVIDASQPGFYYMDYQQWSMPNAVRNFQIKDGYAYIAAAQRGLYIFDLENGVLLSELNMTGEALDVRVKGDHAYIVAKQEGLLVADISDKSNPVWLEGSSRSTVGWAQSIDLEEDYLVVGSGGGGVYLYDIGTNPAEPRFLERVTESVVDYVLLVAIRDAKVYVAGRYLGVSEFNINR